MYTNSKGFGLLPQTLPTIKRSTSLRSSQLFRRNVICLFHITRKTAVILLKLKSVTVHTNIHRRK